MLLNLRKMTKDWAHAHSVTQTKKCLDDDIVIIIIIGIWECAKDKEHKWCKLMAGLDIK